jgi:hypothetical protein
MPLSIGEKRQRNTLVILKTETGIVVCVPLLLGAIGAFLLQTLLPSGWLLGLGAMALFLTALFCVAASVYRTLTRQPPMAARVLRAIRTWSVGLSGVYLAGLAGLVYLGMRSTPSPKAPELLFLAVWILFRLFGLRRTIARARLEELSFEGAGRRIAGA